MSYVLKQTHPVYGKAGTRFPDQDYYLMVDTKDQSLFTHESDDQDYSEDEDDGFVDTALTGMALESLLDTTDYSGGSSDFSSNDSSFDFGGGDTGGGGSSGDW